MKWRNNRHKKIMAYVKEEIIVRDVSIYKHCESGDGKNKKLTVQPLKNGQERDQQYCG
jgi:hypothetical protein